MEYKLNSQLSSNFKQFHSDLLKTFSDTELKNFSNLNDDEQRLEYVYRFKSVHDYKIGTKDGFKSAESAKQLKDYGNKAFQSNQFKTALVLYSKGITKQPQNSSSDKQELSIMFANRSAAFYHIKDYDHALEDIESALNNGYPSDLQCKILDRKSRCLLALNHLKSARDGFRQTIQALDNAKLTIERRQKWQRDIQIMLAMLDKNKDLRDASKKRSAGEKPELKDGINRQYPAASSVVSIKEGQDVGRFAEAKSDIKPGDFLLREKPYCSILLDQYSKTHCFQCFLRVVAAYPCPSCSLVVFCGKKCQEEALRTHHRVECNILPTLWQAGVSVTCLMSLRIITQQCVEYFLQLRPSLKNVEINKEEKSYKSSDYIRLANLVNHANQRNSEDFLHRTFMAIFLLRCLQQTKYFSQESGNNEKECGEICLKEEERFIGGLILKHLQILQFNSHEVSEMVVDGKDRRTVFIGAAVYPTLALFNHSCNPGIVRYQKGTEVIVRAVRNIRSGEMIAENYGPMFTQTPRAERQSTLKSQYWFDCNCEACSDNWPTLKNMDPSVMRFRCQCDSIVCIPIDTNQFMFPCHKCNQHVNIFKGLKVLQDTDIMFRLGKSLVDEGNTTAALHKFTELLNLLDSTLVPPFQDYHLCQQQLRTCMVACGNVYDETKLS